jgi:hypothetical protein
VILSAARGWAWIGALVALIVAAAHVTLRREPRELRAIGLAVLIGLLVDSTLALTGQVRFASPWPAGLAPYWMLSLWAAFATTLNHSMHWLMTRPVGAALAGAAGGPLAYLAGARLGALTLVTPATTLAIISLLWTLAMVSLSMFVLRASTVPAERSPA